MVLDTIRRLTGPIGGGSPGVDAVTTGAVVILGTILPIREREVLEALGLTVGAADGVLGTRDPRYFDDAHAIRAARLARLADIRASANPTSARHHRRHLDENVR